jgi:hypothetical protein
MRKALIVLAVLLLIPVIVFLVLERTDPGFRIAEAPPGQVNAVSAAFLGCGLAALLWLGVSIVRRRGRILADLKSVRGAVCLLLAAASAAAWAWHLGLTGLKGLWYDLP